VLLLMFVFKVTYPGNRGPVAPGTGWSGWSQPVSSAFSNFFKGGQVGRSHAGRRPQAGLGALVLRPANWCLTVSADGSDDRPRCPLSGVGSGASEGIRAGIGSNHRETGISFTPCIPLSCTYTVLSELKRTCGSEADVARCVVSERTCMADV
jgi:hypothetical protein